MPSRKLWLEGKISINYYRIWLKIFYRSINGERNNKNTSQHVHHGDGKEEEVMSSMKMVAFLDDDTEDEVAKETNDDDDKVEDHIAPTSNYKYQ